MSNTIIEREHESIYQTYKRLPIEVEYAHGCRIHSIDGKEYLDFLSGIAVNVLGHSHPAIINAVQKQISKYMHVSNYFYQKPQVELSEKMKKYSGMDKVFFTNSGTEATEAAIKLCRKWGNTNGKSEIISFSGGFHGRSYAALSIMDKPLYKDGMGPFLPNTKIIQFNNIESLHENINSDVTAVVIELIQGEGGIVSASSEFLDEIKKLKDKYGFLFVIDEIQTGCGRTGTYFAYQQYDIQPDIVTVAKGIGGGLPLGAMLVNKKLANIWEKGMHGTTFGGNAVACAAGLAIIEELENGVLENVRNSGVYFINELEKIKSKYPEKIKEVRGKGFFLGLQLNFEASILIEKLLEQGVIANATSSTVLRILPPLIAGKNEIDEFILKLDGCLSLIP